ncbi:MAG: protein kinase [Deltaproteobacteria bacterium]|nr:protein kinase [Deltaproteobacteria bacterium]
MPTQSAQRCSDEGRVQLSQSRVGSQLDARWRLEVLLCVDATGGIYSARHRLGKRAAVKLLHRDECENAERVACFRRQAEVANQLDHPGVVSVIDDGIAEDGAPWLAMELVEGESLASRLARTERLELRDAVALAGQLLEVLVAVHEKGVAHGCLHPRRVLVTPAHWVKVLGLGIVQEMRSAIPSLEDVALLELVAPELATEPPLELEPKARFERAMRADIWGVGAVLYWLLAGKPVRSLGEVAPADRLALIRSTPPSKLQVVAPGVPDAVAAVVDRALALEPEGRWPRAKEMLGALRAAEQGGSWSRWFASPASTGAHAQGSAPAQLAPPNSQALVADPHQTAEDDLSEHVLQHGRWTLAVGAAVLVSFGLALSLTLGRSSSSVAAVSVPPVANTSEVAPRPPPAAPPSQPAVAVEARVQESPPAAVAPLSQAAPAPAAVTEPKPAARLPSTTKPSPPGKQERVAEPSPKAIPARSARDGGRSPKGAGDGAQARKQPSGAAVVITPPPPPLPRPTRTADAKEEPPASPRPSKSEDLLDQRN